MHTFVYTDDKRREISFPIGGIGTGCVGIAGDGRLIDWEIFNRPNKQSYNGFSSIVLRSEQNGEVIDIRALQGPTTANLMGAPSNYGFGPARESCAGWNHFKSNTFRGDFPIAQIDFTDEHFAGEASLIAFNPFIPLDAFNSSLPVAMFEIQLTNRTDAPVHYTACMTVRNPIELMPANRMANCAPFKGAALVSASHEKERAQYGNLCALTDADDADVQLYWYRGAWFDGPSMFFEDLRESGRLRGREYADSAIGDHAVIAAHADAAAGQTVRVRFALAWYFPNQYAYWRTESKKHEEAVAQWKNYYATQFESAEDVARYALSNFDSLYNRTKAFSDALYQSEMPREAMEAVAANLSVLKSPTCLRLENGEFYGWEGCSQYAGSCEGSCTHVWNYAYALPCLFPELERSMRELDYTYNLDADGRMGFRLMLPLGSQKSSFRACCDGQFGGVIKMYREWKILGDDAWLAKWWQHIKSALAYAWSPNNRDMWDADMDGVLEGRQHHTLDMELFGPNSWLSGMYLAALKAASEMARALSDEDARTLYIELFNRGRAWVDKNLFNGEYYTQKIDLSDRGTLEKFADGQAAMSGDTMSYWCDESEELKYQIGEGCAIDQVLGQWHADLVGLGDIFDSEQVAKALKSIYRYNFSKRLGDIFNPCRVYGLEEERGALICAYPNGARKPRIPVPYAQEVMHGFEYQAASHMIMRGMEAEGLEIIASVRKRYDGAKRNPWNEMECGSNYARSMASYALMLIYSGVRFDATSGKLSIKPKHFNTGQRAFFSANTAWGQYVYDGAYLRIEVIEGELIVRELEINAREVIKFDQGRVVKSGEPLVVSVNK